MGLQSRDYIRDRAHPSKDKRENDRRYKDNIKRQKQSEGSLTRQDKKQAMDSLLNGTPIQMPKEPLIKRIFKRSNPPT